jgi:hypothetical protein
MNATLGVHVHIIDGDAERWRDLASEAARACGRIVGVTAEKAAPLIAQSGIAPRAYYVAIRYVRFLSHVSATRRPAWLMDVDASFRRDPTSTFSAIRGYDVALLGYANHLEPWNKIAGGLFGVSPTDRGLDYLRRASSFILRALKDGKLLWFADQLALFGAYSYLVRQMRAPHTWFMGPEVVTLNDESSAAIVNFVSGARKHVLL